MFGPKIYELSLVKTYVAHWGMAEAVRELIQNALDSASPFVYEFVVQEGMDTVSLRLNSEFTVLTPQTLLLGATSKAQDADAIGSFGEGFKIALLVLTRLGYDVDVQNGPHRWKPRFKFNQRFGDELLVIEEDDWPYEADKGLTFFVHGLDEQDVETIRASCLRMQADIGEVKKTTMGDILLERPGQLFVGGLFVCQTELDFGYNILPGHVKLERDRQTVDSWDLKDIVKRMWFDTKDYNRIAEMIEAEVPDVAYAEYGSPELVREACYQLFRSKNPGKVIAKTNEEMKEYVARGLTVYVGGGNYYSNVRSSASYVTENKAVLQVETPEQMLRKWFTENRGEMRSKAIESFRKEVLQAALGWTVK
jgi:hypothetical protein